MNINDFLAISIVGVMLSGIIQIIKARFGTDGIKTKILTAVLSIVIGALFVFFKDSQFWPTVILILGAASTVYALFFK